MKLIYPTVILFTVSVTANKWGTRKCKTVKKLGEVNGDCDNELVSCSTAKTVDDATYQNCVNIQVIDAFWSPPKFHMCDAKYTDQADIDTCHQKIKDLIVACHTNTDYFKSTDCIDLSAYKIELEIMDDVNVVSDEILNNKSYFWKVPKPCANFQNNAVSDGNTATATTEQSDKYTACLTSYNSMIPLQITCEGGDASACSSWWDHQANIPDGQRTGNPYNPNTKIKVTPDNADCSTTADATLCEAAKISIPALKDDCILENEGDITKNGSCLALKTERKKLLPEKTVRLLPYDICYPDDGDHATFGTDTGLCETAVDQLNTAKTDCLADETSTACDDIRTLKKQLFPTEEKDLCAGSDDPTTCNADLSAVRDMQANCAAELAGDDTQNGQCDALKIKKKEIGTKGNELNEAFKQPKRDLCKDAVDATVCEADKSTLKNMREECRKEAKNKVDAVVGSCDDYEAKKIELFPTFFKEKTGHTYCADQVDGSAEKTECEGKIADLKPLQDDCQAENTGDATKAGSCQALKNKRKDLLPPKQSQAKVQDESYCEDDTKKPAEITTDDCKALIGEIQALRPDCIAENKGDATKDGSCDSLKQKRNTLRPKEGYEDPCATATDVATCQAQQTELKGLQKDCRDERAGDTTKDGSCDALKAKRIEYAPAGAHICDTKPVDEQDACKTAAASLSGLRKACRDARANNEIFPQSCIDFSAAQALVPKLDKPNKQPKDQTAPTKPPRLVKKPDHPCTTLPAENQGDCYQAYGDMMALKKLCKTDRDAGNRDSQNCKDLRAKQQALPVQHAEKEKIPQNLCQNLPTDEQDACNAAYIIIQDRFPKCQQAKSSGEDPLVNLDCIDFATNLAYIPKKKTMAEKQADANVHPCESLSTDEEKATCYTTYDSLDALRSSCKTDKINKVENSTNCADLKTALASVPRPDTAAKKKAQLQANGGIILRNLKKRSIEYVSGGKTMSYRR